MNLSYRTEHNAKAISAFWGKSLDRRDWYEIKSQSEDQTELIVYDVIGFPWNDASELVRTISGITSKEILVRISSPGGDLFDSLSIYNSLVSHKAKIITRNESLAASAATILMLAGKERQAYKSSMAMIHEPWALVVGNQHDMRDFADVLSKINDNMIDIYAGGTNIGKREWKEKMEKGETWWNAREMKDNGFIHTILDGKPVKAQFDLSIFNNLPSELSEGDDEPIVRKYEKALRDVGASKSQAKAILARGLKATADDEEAKRIEAEQKELAEVMAELRKGISVLSMN